MTQVNMSLVGMTNVTVTMFNDEMDTAEVHKRLGAKHGDGWSEKDERAAHFHAARVRLQSTGALGTRVFPV